MVGEEREMCCLPVSDVGVVVVVIFIPVGWKGRLKGEGNRGWKGGWEGRWNGAGRGLQMRWKQGLERGSKGGCKGRWEMRWKDRREL